MKLARKSKVFLLIGVPVLVLAFFLLQPPKPVPTPNPNGYVDFVAAGQMLSGDPPDTKTASMEKLREFVAANRAALERGRLGLRKRCGVPTEYSSTWIGDHWVECVAVKKLSFAFCAEGDLARLEKRPGDAATSYLAAIEMGARLAHGGVMIDGLVATACEGAGERCFSSMIETLDDENSRKFMDELEQVEAEREPVARILDCEKAWASAQLRSVSGFEDYVREVANTHSLNPGKTARTDFVAEYETRLQRLPQLQAKLAAHAYRLEKGRLPADWKDLVPAYLKSVPKVPFGPGDTNRLQFR